jgi:hypothetical protein
MMMPTMTDTTGEMMTGAATTSKPAPRPRPGSEPVIALPTARLLVVTVVACTMAGAGSSLIAQLAWPGEGLAMVGPAAATVVALAMVGGLLAVVPWRPRPIGLWPTLWLASTVLRMLLTPILAYLLYSATPFGAAALAINVVAAYLLALAGEVIVLAGFLKRTFPA